MSNPHIGLVQRLALEQARALGSGATPINVLIKHNLMRIGSSVTRWGGVHLKKLLAQ